MRSSEEWPIFQETVKDVLEYRRKQCGSHLTFQLVVLKDVDSRYRFVCEKIKYLESAEGREKSDFSYLHYSESEKTESDVIYLQMLKDELKTDQYSFLRRSDHFLSCVSTQLEDKKFKSVQQKLEFLEDQVRKTKYQLECLETEERNAKPELERVSPCNVISLSMWSPVSDYNESEIYLSALQNKMAKLKKDPMWRTVEFIKGVMQNTLWGCFGSVDKENTPLIEERPPHKNLRFRADHHP